MKNIAILVIVVLLTQLSFSQTMIVHKKDQTTVGFPLSQIDSITFSLQGVVPTQGLVAYYSFSGNANDSSGNGNDGLVIGATPATDRFGVPNKAYYFGDSKYITVVNSASLNTLSSLTISAWINLDSTVYQQSKGIVSSAGTSGTDYVLAINGDAGYSKVRPHVYTGMWAYSDGTTVLSANNWYHVVMTYDGVNLKSYVNGIYDVGTKYGSVGGPIRMSGFPLSIGRCAPPPSDPGYMHGLIDDIRIYNRALSDEEIYGLYHEGGW